MPASSSGCCARPATGSREPPISTNRKGDAMPETIDQDVIKADVKDTAADDIARRVDAERARLRAAAGLVQLQQQFKRPVERPFTAAERGKVTMLIGGMTWKHDNMFRAVFEGCGYKCETLPVPD